MIITFTIQEIRTKEILFSDVLQTVNRTDLINFLNTSEFLRFEEDPKGETYLFYLEEGEAVFYERYIDSVSAANNIKDNILDYVASGALSFDGANKIQS